MALAADGIPVDVERAEALRQLASERQRGPYVAQAPGSRAVSSSSRSCLSKRDRPAGTLYFVAQNLGSFEKVLRVGEGRRLKRLAQQAAYIGTLEPEFEALSDDELRGKTAEFNQRIENGETLEEILFDAYAAMRERSSGR